MCRRVLRRTRASNLRSHLLHFSRMDGGMEEKKQEYRLTLYMGQYIEVLMAKANVPPNVTPNVLNKHKYTLRTFLHVYCRIDDGKKVIKY